MHTLRSGTTEKQLASRRVSETPRPMSERPPITHQWLCAKHITGEFLIRAPLGENWIGENGRERQFNKNSGCDLHIRPESGCCEITTNPRVVNTALGLPVD